VYRAALYFGIWAASWFAHRAPFAPGGCKRRPRNLGEAPRECEKNHGLVPLARGDASLRSSVLANDFVRKSTRMILIRLISRRPLLTAVALTVYAVVLTICLWAVFSIALLLSL
jgi:hypothetical protein